MRTISSTASILTAAALGAAAMYLLDPQSGEERRETLLEGAQDLRSRARSRVSDLSDRAQDLFQDMRSGVISKRSYTEAMQDKAGELADYIRKYGKRSDLMSKLPSRRQLQKYYRGQSSSLRTLGIIAGIGIGLGLAGAAAFYFMPEERREQIKEKADEFYGRASDSVSSTTRKVSERAGSVAQRAKQMIGRGGDDRKLADRVHFELNRLPFELRGLHVRCDPGGKVHIYGDVSAEHYDQITRTAESVSGVRQVFSHLQATAGSRM